MCVENIISDIAYNRSEWQKQYCTYFGKIWKKKKNRYSIDCFLVGHRNWDKHQVKFTKEQKQDLIRYNVPC